MALVNDFDSDAFSAGQIQSKLWLAQRLEDALLDEMPTDTSSGYRILILAGWYGVTNLLLRTRTRVPIEYVCSVDLDPACKVMSEKINNAWSWRGEFASIVYDINHFDYTKNEFNVVINTSVEHLASDEWYYNIPKGTLVCLQASNMDHDDHVNKINNARELIEKYPMGEVIYDGIKLFDFGDFQFHRSMIIGIK